MMVAVFGGANEIGGNKILVEHGDSRIMLDFGMNFGAQGDYFAGQYELAISGFTDYIRSFPKSDLADDAQVLICNAYVNDGKYQKAVEACDLAIRTYPNGDKIPEAYYRKGLALQGLKDLGGARDAFERAIKADPQGANGVAGGLAKQGLDRLKRP